MGNYLRSLPQELSWAAGIGTALHFPALWGILLLVAAWKLGLHLSLRHTLWLQSRRGPHVIEIGGRRFACLTHRDGTHSATEIQAAH